jgi:hypothetical protein
MASFSAGGTTHRHSTFRSQERAVLHDDQATRTTAGPLGFFFR